MNSCKHWIFPLQQPLREWAGDGVTARRNNASPRRPWTRREPRSIVGSSVWFGRGLPEAGDGTRPARAHAAGTQPVGKPGHGVSAAEAGESLPFSPSLWPQPELQSPLSQPAAARHTAGGHPSASPGAAPRAAATITPLTPSSGLLEKLTAAPGLSKMVSRAAWSRERPSAGLSPAAGKNPRGMAQRDRRGPHVGLRALCGLGRTSLTTS